jgi:hypothetical protein
MISKLVSHTNTAWVWAFLILLGFPFVLVLLASCSNLFRETELDSSLLANGACAPPCWNNITPGVSTEDDVRSQLEESLLVQGGCSVDYGLTEREGVPLTVFSWQSSSGEGNWIYLKDKQVLWMYIGLENELTLGEIVEEYGPPESVYASLIRTGYLRYYIEANYPAQGMEFSTTLHPCDPDNTNCEDNMILSEDVAMTTALYFAPTSLEGMYGEVFLLPADEMEHYLANSQEWQGFGRIQVAKSP